MPKSSWKEDESMHTMVRYPRNNQERESYGEIWFDSVPKNTNKSDTNQQRDKSTNYKLKRRQKHHGTNHI